MRLTFNVGTAVELPHLTVKKLCQPAGGARQALNGASITQPAPVEAAEGSGSGRRPSIRGGGISAAAATAVAQIRRRRTAAREHTLQLHATSAATALTANMAGAAVPAAPAAAPASAPASAGPSAAVPGSTDTSRLLNRDAQPGPATTRAADLSSAAPQQSDTSHAAHSQPAEVTDQATAGASRGRQPMDRALSVSRPPLPFHAIRRSARLHKAADTTHTAHAGPSQPNTGDQADVQCAAGRPLSDANMVAETFGPCTRYALCVPHEQSFVCCCCCYCLAAAGLHCRCQ